jgi:MtN3 and saliva related transmembrane protein
LQFGEVLGLIAGAITTGSFIPQVIRVYKLRSAREISLFFTILFVVGDALWLSYGIFLQSFPIVLWNCLGGVFAIMLLIGKLRYNKGSVVTNSEDKN